MRLISNHSQHRWLLRGLLTYILLITSLLVGALMLHRLAYAQSAGPSYTTAWLDRSEPTIINNSIQAGGTYTIYVQLRNTGSTTDSPLLLVKNPNESYVSYVPVGDSDPPSGNYRYCTSCVWPEGGAAPSWYWNYYAAAVPPGSIVTAPMSFRTQPSTPNGTRLCFQAVSWNRGQFSEIQERCLIVGGSTTAPPPPPQTANSQRPFLRAAGSIHAGSQFGSEPCLSNQSQGGIRGVTTTINGSLATHTVSAGGTVSDFGSGGTPDSSALILGNQLPLGRYGVICRPDIAKRYLIDQPMPALPTNTFGVDYLPEGISTREGAVTITGGTLPRARHATLVVKGGVYISGNIDFEDSYSSADQIPSLAIVATGQIHIDPAVSRLYGIYYAGTASTTNVAPFSNAGIINTCQRGHIGTFDPVIRNNASTSECATPLQVNGALVATNIYFRRTGGDVNKGSSEAAETVTYLPQLLLQPPPGFARFGG